MKRPHLPVDSEYVSTAAVAAALGVSVTTVKRWVDTEILPAHRTAGGHRKLLRADVLRLCREGELPQANLARLDGRRRTKGRDEPAVLAEQLAIDLRAGDGQAVRHLVHSAYRFGMPLEILADEIIAPAMARIGHEWETGDIDVMHEHRGTQLVAAALFELKAAIDIHAAKGRPVAVGGGIERDHYILPTLLAQLALLDNGWEAVNLGPNTPFASLQLALDEYRPKLVWLSISYLADAATFEREYRAFFAAAHARDVAVAIGGRALPEELRERIPYTTYGDGLQQLVAFARTLHPRPRRPRRGRPPGS